MLRGETARKCEDSSTEDSRERKRCDCDDGGALTTWDIFVELIVSFWLYHSYVQYILRDVQERKTHDQD